MSKSPSLRRIQADIRELSKDPSDRYHAAPLEDDMFEWHFTIRGAEETDFEGGLYHGRILLPPEYPFKPPHIIFLTPSGRFETNTKICLSFSAYHPELWQPAWGIRLILEALISFLPTPSDGAIGSLDWTPLERKRLAKKSVNFVCPKCGPVCKLIPQLTDNQSKNKGNVASNKPSKYEKEIESLHHFQLLNEKKKNLTKTTKEETTATKEETKIVDDASKEKDNIHVQGTNVTTITSSPSVTESDSPTTNKVEITSVRNSTPTTDSQSSWSLYDPVLHGSIVTFVAIVYLLFRKVESLLVELENLQD